MSHSKTTIREAELSDLPSIIGLYAQLSVGSEELLPLPEARQLFSRIRSYPNYNIYVVVAGEEIIGTFALLIMDNLAHRGEPSAIVEDVVVKSDRQGEGIGKAMMEFAMMKSREAGCYKIVLSSNMNREAAHKFYETLGFRKYGYSFEVKTEGYN
jgi:ribosomal protein S18 acetylase RimI-like enzyme